MYVARPEQDQKANRKLSLVGGKTFAVSLPVDIIRILKWKKGDDIIVRRHGNKVIIEKKERS